MDLEKRLLEIEHKLENSIQVIKELKLENQELKQHLDENNNLKRSACLAGMELTAIKKHKKISPENINPDLVDSTFSSNSEERRLKMKEMLGQFKTEYGTRYHKHLEEERRKCPKLRAKDGTIIKKNIRYIR